ncbi:MAG: hypothetical protein ACREK3_07115 [Gemmatimonadota bacterium]
MKARYLEVTYRKGKPLAAYLYLPREPGVKSVRTERATDRILVDFDDGNRPMGLEITDPDGVTVDEINRVLQRLGQVQIAPEELAPFAA